MKTYLVLLLLILATGAHAQNVQLFSHRADSCYQAKSYTAAAALYLKAADQAEFKSGKTGAYYNAACCYALSGNPGQAFAYLHLAVQSGYRNVAHLKTDADLVSLHGLPGWKKLTALETQQTSTPDPYQAQLVTTDIVHFWDAYDRAQKDTANELAIYRKYYIDKGSPGLQDYFANKVHSLKSFVQGHRQRAAFYAAIRQNTYTVNQQKKQMQASFVKLKSLYPEARFPNIYFVIGNFTSGGTVSDNGLLIGLDQAVRTPDIPTGELNLWQKNNFSNLKDLPHLIAHELIHFQQDSVKEDTTLLSASITEGMADFFGELISGTTSNERLHTFARGREKQIWADFKKDMYLNRARNWIANANQETPDHPADLGYWVGYQICKAYYNQSADKKQAVYDMLHIKGYRKFYGQSRVEEAMLK